MRMVKFCRVVRALICLLLPACISGGRAYPLGCSGKDPSFYDYDKNYSWPPPKTLCRSSEDFWLLQRLGSGKFSDVFEALEVRNDESIDVVNNANGKILSDRDKDTRSNRLVVIKLSALNR